MSEATFSVQEIVVEVAINAPREAVWEALTSGATGWWPRDFYVNSDSTTFRIDARIGGYMCEEVGGDGDGDGDGGGGGGGAAGDGTIWGTVTHVKKHESLRLSTEIWPEFGGPARTIQKYEFTETPDGTLLRFTDTMYGRVAESTLKSMSEGWNYLMGRALKDFVEEGKKPPATSPLSC